jgi:twinkle protein
MWQDIVIMVYCFQIAIAFTYRRDGILIGCKYREVSKKFSQVCVHHPSQMLILLYYYQNSLFLLFYQEANTEKILYGLDDIKCAHDIIIVCSKISI